MRFRLAAALLLLASGCFFYDSTWHQETHSQERQAEALSPDAPRAAEGDGNEQWRVLREVKVRAWATERYRAEVHAWRAHVSDLLEQASEVLGPVLGIRLVLADAREWEVREGDSLEELVEALEAEDTASDVGLVIGLIGSLPQLSTSFHQLGMARMHGHHLVMRAMNDAGEADAIDEAFDRLPAEERARVRRRRETHKETATLLHEIGHAYGAIHVRDRTALMSPVYDDDMERFAPGTVALIRAAAAQRRLPEAERDEQALMDELLSVLREEERTWAAAEHQALVAQYEQAIRGGRTAQSVDAPERADGAGTLWDITSLAPEEREAFHRAREAGRAGRVGESWELLAPLVEAHPDVYAVHELACELHNRRVAPGAARSCDRMMELATSFGRQ